MGKEPKDRLKQRILAASGEKKAELVLKNASIINVFTESVVKADIAVEDGYIAGIGKYEGMEEVDLKERYVCSGFIDGHIHLESSMVLPSEFERAVLPHGTTAVITDPHEITNVAGAAGMEYMLRKTKDLCMDVFFMLPSCVPSTGLDESGARMNAEALAPFYREPRVLGLAEMMNSYGTVRGDSECLEKICGAYGAGKIIDGHAPLLSGKALQAYVSAGVASDHECSNLQEALEKLACGQWIMIRQGTAAHNLESLTDLFQPPFYQRVMLVTDDKHPGDLIRGGHIDGIIRRAVELGADPVKAIKMGTCNPASFFGLKDRGAVAPGYVADLVIFEDFKTMKVAAVYKNGRLAAENGRLLSGNRIVSGDNPQKAPEEEKVFHSFHLSPITRSSLEFHKHGSQQRVIDLVAHELTTRERILTWREHPGFAPGVDIRQDIVKLAVFERHHNTGHRGLGFLGRYGLKKGAVATSIGHDSHNLVVAGVTDEDMMAAGNRVIENQGGLALALDGKVLADLPLPVAGLMSALTLEETESRLEELKRLSRKLGISDDIDPFMTLAFVSLPVIPKLRLNTYGVIDVERQEIVEAVY